MTSSAVASNDDRTVRPSILAVWALMTDQFELGRLHHRQVRRLGSFEDASGIGAHLTIGIRQARPLAQQPAGLSLVECGIAPPEQGQKGNQKCAAEGPDQADTLIP